MVADRLFTVRVRLSNERAQWLKASACICCFIVWVFCGSFFVLFLIFRIDFLVCIFVWVVLCVVRGARILFFLGDL